MKNLTFILFFICSFSSRAQITWEYISSPGISLTIDDVSLGRKIDGGPGGYHGTTAMLKQSTDYFQNFYNIYVEVGQNGCCGAYRSHFKTPLEGAIALSNLSSIYAMRTNDGGQTWYTIPAGGMALNGSFYYKDPWTTYSAFSLPPPNTESYFSVGDQWQTTYITTAYKFKNYSIKPKIQLIDSTIFLACSDSTETDALVLKSDNEGLSWNEVLLVQNTILHEVFSFEDSILFVTGTNGLIMYSSDKGTSWNTAHSNPAMVLKSIEVASDGIGFAVGDAGTILRTSDYGMNWMQVNAPDTTDFIYVRMFEGDIAYTYDSLGNLYTNRGDILSLQKEKVSSDIQVYPNPSNGELNIEHNNQSIDAVEIVDLSGRSVKQFSSVNSKSVSLEVEGLAGLYFVKDYSGFHVYIERVVFE